MGLLGVIFNTIRSNRKYSKMSVQELAQLDDEKLDEAMMQRLYVNLDSLDDCKNNAQRTYYVILNFNAEVANGGLCQFFVNSSRECAPFVSEALDRIHSQSAKTLFDKFVGDNNIDVNDLDSFIIDDVDEFEAQTKRYPFDDFDDAYYEVIGDVEQALIRFERENINKLAE